MRLVDWDKVKISYDKQVSGTIAEPVYNINVEAPTVDAIPIEWIRKYTNHRTVEFGDMWVFINCMINDWEKENGVEESNRNI